MGATTEEGEMVMNEDGVASSLRGMTEQDMRRAQDVAERMRVEAKAWKIAQLAATLMGGGYYAAACTTLEGTEQCVGLATSLLAESRRQACAPAGREGGRDDG